MHLKKMGNMVDLPQKKPLLCSSQNLFLLQYANEHRDRPKNFWNKILCDETKIDFLPTALWLHLDKRKQGLKVHYTVKHGGGSLTFWDQVKENGQN